MKYRHDMPFGARLNSRGGAEFTLWAPAARQVVLHHGASAGGPMAATPAQSRPDGWWHAEIPQATGATRYQWQVNDGPRVPDPASRSNPGGPHEASEVTDPHHFDWQVPWQGLPWSDVVLYELHVGTFTPQGTLAAALQQLPRLRDLGITAVELMPLACFGGRHGWGYDGVLPFAPHPDYGTPDDLKRFIDGAHALGLMVFLDVVYNHFGPDGNYLGLYAPQFFSEKHTSPWGAAINFDGDQSEAVREFFIHNAMYWIGEFRFDGLRLDAVHAIVDDSHPGFLAELSQRVRTAFAGRHVHLVLENEKNQSEHLAPGAKPSRYDAQWNDDFHHALHVLLTGETKGYYADYGTEPLALIARSLTNGYIFAHSERDEHARRRQVVAAAPEPLSTMVQFFGNHDQVGNRAFGERLAQLVPAPAVELALLMTLLGPATPLIFMGDEFGATTPFLYFADWQGELRDAVRKGRLREFGHEVPPGGTLPDPCDQDTFARSRLDWQEAESPEGQARQALLREALAVRRQWLNPRLDRLAPRGHSAQRVGSRGLRVQWQYEDGAQWRMDINLGDDPIPAPVPGDSLGTLRFSHRWNSDDTTWAPWSARWCFLEPNA